jgi:hypothetical protein
MAMSEDLVKQSIDNFNEYALKAFTKDWRDVRELSADPELTPDGREFYRQKAEEFHAEMVKLGHKHGRISRQ